MRAAQVALVAAIGAGCGGGQHGGRGPTCADAARGVARELVASSRAIAEAGISDALPDLEAICKLDGWSEAARRCFRNAVKPGQARRCTKELTEPQRANASTIGVEIQSRAVAYLRMREERETRTGLAACDRYLAAVDAYLACPHAAGSVKASILEHKRAIDQDLQRMAALTGAPQQTVRDRVAVSCQLEADAVAQTTTMAGCPQ